MSENRKKTVDKDGNIIVAIEKYDIGCCFHAIFGFMSFTCVAGAIALFFYGWAALAIVATVIGLRLWVEAWLNANDKLTYLHNDTA